MEPSGGSVVPGRLSASSGTSAHEEQLFEREVERATERAGGREAVEERRAEGHDARRQRRREAFQEHREARRAAEEQAARAPRRAEQAERDGPAPAALPASPAEPTALPAPPLTLGSPLTPPPNPGAQALQPAPGGSALPASPGAPAAPLAAPLRQPASGAPGGAPVPAGPARGGVAGAAATPAPYAPGSEPARPRAAAAPTAPPGPAAPEPPPEAESVRAGDVLRQLRLHLAAGGREATFSLAPAELGRLQVRVQIKDGRVGAIVRGESAATLDLLGSHLPELRAAFAAQGIEVEGFELQLGLDDEHGGRSPDPRPHAAPAAAPASHLDRVLHLPTPARGAVADDGVDTYA
ncbi:MAG: flagellar hook-length control protein FliK [Planctomycetota bacterium]